MNKVYEKLMTCVESIRKRIDFQPEVAIDLRVRSWRLRR